MSNVEVPVPGLKDVMPIRPNPRTLADYKREWAAQPPRSQSEEMLTEMICERAEAQLRSEGNAHIDGERERIAGVADGASRRLVDVQAAARAITKACQSRIVDVEEVADQLVDLEKECARLRALISRIDEQNTWNENRASDPVGVGEALYQKYGDILPHPVKVAQKAFGQ